MQKHPDFTERETEERRDELLKHMLNRPPQPHVTRSSGQPRSQRRAASDHVEQKNVSAETA